MVDKALDSTAKALASLSHGGKDPGPSKGFQTLIKLIGESKTKHEEDRIIRKESVFLKDKVGGKDVSARQMREFLIRMIYCEMLGVDCSWGYIHAVKLTQSTNIMDKRIGYLGVSLFLHANHELNMLLVNTLQRDLKSSNMLQVSMALIVICKLIGSEFIPPLLPLVQDKLLHPKELVRKKAVMVMHRFHQLSPSSISHLEDDFRRALSDQDPGVMEAALILIHDLAKVDTPRFKDLAPSFTNILSQVVARKLPADFDYHGVPAPWIQIRLLRTIAVLGADDLKTSEQFYPVLQEVLASSECTSNIGQAISYECIRTITSIYPNNPLIEKAARSVVRFLTAANNNWKYLGINALGALVKIDPKFVAEHQMVVIDCLDDPDETLKRKTLDLLFQMTNSSNVSVITEKLITYLRQTTNEYVRSDLVAKITQLAERFAPDNLWFIQTMNAVFELGGSLVRREVAHNLMRLIAEGTDDEEADGELRIDAVNSYLEMLDKPNIPDILVKIICWVIGEYSYVQTEIEAEDILNRITGLLNRRFEEDDTYGWIVTAVTKLVSQIGHLPDSVQSQLAIYLTSTSTDIQQRCSELVELSQDLAVMQSVLPLDASCEDLEIDPHLSFLDGFVSESLSKGAADYRPPHLRVPTSSRHKISTSPTTDLKFEPYAAPATPSYPHPSSPPLTRHLGDPPPSLTSDQLSAGHSSPSLVHEPVTTSLDTEKSNFTYSTGDGSPGLAVKDRKWGRSGYNKATTPSYTETTPTFESTKPEEQTDGSPDKARENTPTIALSTVQASPLELTQEDKKKSQLASQIFGVLSGPSRAPRSKPSQRVPSSGEPRPAAATRATVRTPQQKKEPEIDLLLDLQDIDFSQPVTSSQPQLSSGSGLFSDLSLKTPPTSEVDLLGGVDQPESKPTPVLNLMDSVGSSPPIGRSSQSELPALEPTHSSLLDELSSIDTSVVAPPTSGTALSLYEGGMGARIPAELAVFPVVAGWESRDICRDASIRVTATKVLKPDQLVVVLFVTNQKQAEVSGVSLNLEKPSNTKATTLDGNTELSLTANIPGFGTVTQVVVLVPSSPAINMNLSGQVSYTDGLVTQKRLFLDITLHVSDMIRPWEISTAEFGKKWGSFTHEKRLKLQSSIKKPADFMTAVKERMNLHAVEIIGVEGICAGTFLPSTACLVHGKIGKTHLDVWVKTSSNLLTESVAKLAQSVFKD